MIAGQEVWAAWRLTLGLFNGCQDVLNRNEGRKDRNTGRRVRAHLRSTNKDSRKERSRLESWISEPEKRRDERSENDKNLSHLTRIRPHQTGTTREKNLNSYGQLLPTHDWLLCKTSLERNSHKYLRKI